MSIVETPVQSQQLNISGNTLASLLLGDAALTEKEINIICKRKGRSNRGMSSNEILAYLYLKQHSSNGWYRFFRHSDFVDALDISDRDVYHVLTSLENLRLIKVHGKKYSHYRDIRIYHIGVKPKTRFLSLNRTYFRSGEDDYIKFKELSAGAKSMLIYILYKEKFKPDAHGNAIELIVKEIAHFMGLKKATVIEYIKEINEQWENFLVIQNACYGTTGPARLAALLDRRRRYGAISSKFDNKTSTSLVNNSAGFWRSFDLWLKSHGIKERSIRERLLYDSSTHGTLEERITRNRELFYNIIYSCLVKGISTFDIFKTFYQMVHETGYFDENVTFGMARLIPRET